MQGLQMSSQTAQSTEQLTVVLLTHNRPAFLRRALRYYSQFSLRIMVLDSSTESGASIAAQFSDIDYRYIPQFGYSGFQSKLKYGAAQVQTSYMVFAADDDFILHEGLSESVAFLEGHPDYGMCHGYCLMYLTHARQVSYYRRDRKINGDFNADSAQERVVSFMHEFQPPFYAVIRTALQRLWLDSVPEDVGFEWMEISHVYVLLGRAKARTLHMPYVVREVNWMQSDHDTDVLRVLLPQDEVSAADRERMAEVLARQIPPPGLDFEQAKALALDSFAAMLDSLITRRALDMTQIFHSFWHGAVAEPERRFEPLQYVELPFYNKPFFDQLTTIEFLLHAMPAGRLQLQQLEGIWTRQEALLEQHPNDTPATITNRLWEALDLNVFNRHVVAQLVNYLHKLGEEKDAADLRAWSERLEAIVVPDHREQLARMPSGRLRHWLQARTPELEQIQLIDRYLLEHRGGPQFCILLLDLDDDMEKLHVTLDSLLEGAYKAFKIVVLTTGTPPTVTTAQNTLHFVSVTRSHYVDRLNQAARESSCDWLMLVEAGDQFTPAGLTRAGLELLAAPECRAVAADEIHRRDDGTLTSVFRPGFNLDLLQSVPSLMARHWLIRRDVMLEAGGFASQFTDALEFDLLLRIIETGGMGWLAHLDEPLLICKARALEERAHERQALTRHLANRGYQPFLSSEQPGVYRVEYGHRTRPLVSVILPCQDNLEQLVNTLDSLRLRTRYTRYEILVVDNASQNTDMLDWLEHAQHSQAKVRVLKSEQPVSLPTLYNAASAQAQGQYLVLLDSDAEVINPNWIESLLNQAQRPEVGIVGAKLVDAQGDVTQAGLILGFENGVTAAFAGEGKNANGYLQRLVADQNYSAVSGACLMISSELFRTVGGLDDDLFAQALSDVDLCLKVGQAGSLVVWTPYVQVIHSGAVVQTPSAIAALRGKWSAVFDHDLAYNRNLSQSGLTFDLGKEAGIPWAPLLTTEARHV
jgi:glycosyltransferase domain-containing protein